MKRQAVITGLGIVSPIGIGVEKFWAAARAGRSGIGRPTLFDASNLPPECHIVGEVRDFNYRDWMPAQTGRIASRFSQFAVAAAQMACSDAQLESAGLEPQQIKVAIGTATLGISDVYNTNYRAFLDGAPLMPWGVLESAAHAASSHVAIINHVRGQTTTFSTACAAGLDAICWACDEVEGNRAEAVIAGGSETPLSDVKLSLFQSTGVLSKWQGPPQAASRPFEKHRSGLVLAEGAAIVVIENEERARARGAKIYARILGSGSVTEGAHLRKVDETGETVSRALDMALRRSNISPRDIDFISAHGNSMQDYDCAETSGIKRTFGQGAWNIPVFAIKSMCGQALGASGAIQIVAACLVLQDHVAPPTINYDWPDSACDLDYIPNVSRRIRARTGLVHAHSLGGSHVAVVLSAPI